jgi:molecular chaperone DnaK
VQNLVKSLIGKDPHQGVNPDEVVAVGASIQAGVLAGEVKDIVLLDVTPLSLGLETKGGVMTRLIERNTTIPAKRTETFSTADDNQTSVDIHILQGERPMARDNKTLGQFRLEGIPLAPQGVPKIDVTFDIDANGILNVSAKDQATSKEQKITITASTNLSEDEIKRMVNEAEANASEDNKRKEEVEVKNKADALCHSVERQLSESGDKMPEADRTKLKTLVDDLRAAIQGNQMDRIKSLKDELEQAAYAMATKAYESAGGTGEDAAADGPDAKASGNEEEIIDAEFRPSDEGVGATK